MIILKTATELEGIREACKISALALRAGVEAVREGITTKEIDAVVRKTIEGYGAKPAFLGYGGFPGSACISVGDEVIHGIPSANRRIKYGDIVSIDVGAIFKGYYADNAYTVACGEVSEELAQLMERTKHSLQLGIKAAVVDARVGDISHSIGSYLEGFGYGVVRDFVGHGCGKKLHEEPEIPNYGSAGRGARLAAGMTLAIEPMVNLVGHEVHIAKDGWTVLTRSGSPSVHFEHTIAVTDNGPEILTEVN